MHLCLIWFRVADLLRLTDHRDDLRRDLQSSWGSVTTNEGESSGVLVCRIFVCIDGNDVSSVARNHIVWFGFIRLSLIDYVLCHPCRPREFLQVLVTSKRSDLIQLRSIQCIIVVIQVIERVGGGDRHSQYG